MWGVDCAVYLIRTPPKVHVRSGIGLKANDVDNMSALILLKSATLCFIRILCQSIKCYHKCYSARCNCVAVFLTDDEKKEKKWERKKQFRSLLRLIICYYLVFYVFCCRLNFGDMRRGDVIMPSNFLCTNNAEVKIVSHANDFVCHSNWINRNTKFRLHVRVHVSAELLLIMCHTYDDAMASVLSKCGSFNFN